MQVIQMQVALPTLTITRRQVGDEEKQEQHLTNDTLDNPLSAETPSRKRYTCIFTATIIVHCIFVVSRLQLIIAYFLLAACNKISI